MTDAANETKLLPPPTAVGMAWALTGDFVNNPESKDIASAARKIIDNIKEQAEQENSQEQEYVIGAIVVIEATMRTLDTIYKGRELNFKENDKLRDINLNNIQEALQFGKSAKDFLKSLPTMAIASGAGVITLNQLVSSLPSWVLWSVGLGMAGVGYFVNLGFVRWSTAMKQRLYIKQDYERDMYYQQYLWRVRTSLINLYAAIDRLHKKYFGEHYLLEASEDAFKVVEGILEGAMPTMCEHVHEHMKDGRITAELWARCETGGKPAQECKHRGK